MLMHYFVTGLKSSMSREEFMARAHSALSGAVLEDLERLYSWSSAEASEQERRDFWHDLAKKASTEFLKKFAEEAFACFESVAELLEKNTTKKQNIFAVKAKKALEHEDPLILERVLSDELVRIADELLGSDLFSEAEVLSSFIKLTIAERFASFDEAKGQAILTALIANIREGARI